MVINGDGVPLASSCGSYRDYGKPCSGDGGNGTCRSAEDDQGDVSYFCDIN